MKYKNDNKNIIEGEFISKKYGDLQGFIHRVNRANSVQSVTYSIRNKKARMIITVKNTKKLTACASIWRLGKIYDVRVPRVVSKYACNKRSLQKKQVVNTVPPVKVAVARFLSKFFTW